VRVVARAAITRFLIRVVARVDHGVAVVAFDAEIAHPRLKQECILSRGMRMVTPHAGAEQNRCMLEPSLGLLVA
jgi:hypothetical protein